MDSLKFWFAVIYTGIFLFMHLDNQTRSDICIKTKKIQNLTRWVLIQCASIKCHSWFNEDKHTNLWMMCRKGTQPFCSLTCASLRWHGQTGDTLEHVGLGLRWQQAVTGWQCLTRNLYQGGIFALWLLNLLNQDMEPKNWAESVDFRITINTADQECVIYVHCKL